MKYISIIAFLLVGSAQAAQPLGAVRINSDTTGTNSKSSAITVTAQTNLNVGSMVVTSTINKVTITAPASSATLTIANAKTATFNASLTLAGTDATTITFQGTDTYIGRTTTDTLTNKRITPRVQTLTDAATVTPDADSYDGGKLTSVSQTTTIANPTGTPVAFQRYSLRLKSTTTRAISFGSEFRGSADLPLPTSTSGASLTDYLGFQRNTDDSKWDLVAKNFGF